MSKILVVDDEEAVRENIIELLLAEGYDVIGAKNGEEGYRLASFETPDLIICDILMPVLDGYGMLAKVNQDAKLADIPFLFLTARISRADMRKGMELGADDYVTKPFTRKELLQAVDTRIEKRNRLDYLTQKKLSNFRQQVIAFMPHELMTPLSIILGFSEILSEQAVGLEQMEVRSLSNDIHRSAQKLVRLVENYLLYIELDSLTQDPVRVAQLLRSEVFDCGLIIQSQSMNKASQLNRQSDLHLNLKTAKLKVYESHLDKIVDELLENAFERSKKGSQVRVECFQPVDRENYSIRIIDYGEPHNAEVVRAVNGRLQQGLDLLRQQGLNIGMLLVKRLVEFYGGVIRIMTQPEKGNLVEVILPAEIGQQGR